MDLENICLKHENNRSCVEDMAVTIADFFHREYQYMYMGSWLFKYDPIYGEDDDRTLGERLFCQNDDWYSLYTKYSGIYVYYIQCDNPDDMLCRMKKDIDSGDYIVALTHTEMYWLPWTDYYLKKAGWHTFLVKDIDLENRNIIGADAFFQKDKVVLDYESYCKACDNRYIRYELKEIVDTFKDKYKEIRNVAIDRLSSGTPNMFQQMRMFADELKDYDFDREIDKFSTLYALPVYKNIQVVARRRGQFAEFLSYIAGEEDISLLEYRDKFLYLQGMWDKLKIRLGQQIVLKRKYDALSEKILYLADYEERLAKEICGIEKYGEG